MAILFPARDLPSLPALRHVAPPHAPWAAHLTVLDDGSAGMLVDIAVLDDWAGWDLTEPEHVVAPLDILRRSDGHDVLLPACTERLEAVIARRRAARPPLAVGETVTIAVSVIRGLLELARMQRAESRGEWWMTPEARPVFVLGEGAPATEASAQVFRVLLDATETPGVASTLTAALDALTDARRFRGTAEDLDDALVRSAPPAAVAIDRPVGSSEPLRLTASPVDTPDDPQRTSLRERVGATVDGLRRAVTERGRHLRRAIGRGKRGPIVMAAGAAIAALVVLTVLLPTEDDDAAPVLATPSDTRSAPTLTLVPSGPDHDPDDLGSIASAILSARSGCGQDRSCLAGVLEDPSESAPPGAIDLAAENRSIVPIDSFGGVAVVRVEDAAQVLDPQMVVIVAHDDRWLLRDVHDVAEQPS